MSHGKKIWQRAAGPRSLRPAQSGAVLPGSWKEAKSKSVRTIRVEARSSPSRRWPPTPTVHLCEFREPASVASVRWHGGVIAPPPQKVLSPSNELDSNKYPQGIGASPVILCRVLDTSCVLWCKVVQAFLDLRPVRFFKSISPYDKRRWSFRLLRRHGFVTKTNEIDQSTIRVIAEGIRTDC